jgi:hypothetical protein
VKLASFSAREKGPKQILIVEPEKECNDISYSDTMDENNNLWDKVKRVFKRTEETSSGISV